MSQPISRTTHVSQAQQTRPQASTAREIVHGVFFGLVPLLLLALLVIATIGLTTLVRRSTLSAGFFIWERNALITLIVGMIVALLVYVIAIVLVLQITARWITGRFTIRSAAALWTLAITAIVVLLPVIIVVLLPQSPAP